jgi:hypothetical protein
VSAHRGIPRWRHPFHLAAALSGEYGERIQHHIAARYLFAFLSTLPTEAPDA